LFSFDFKYNFLICKFRQQLGVVTTAHDVRIFESLTAKLALLRRRQKQKAWADQMTPKFLFEMARIEPKGKDIMDFEKAKLVILIFK
jgi:hypothetical protein